MTRNSLQRQSLSRQKTAAKRPSLLQEQIAAIAKDYPEQPTIPIEADPVKWLETNRFLRDRLYSFKGYEFLKDIARDDTKSIYVAKGRQLGLSELAVGLILHFATIHAGSVVLYMTSNLEKAKMFSKYRMKQQTIAPSPNIAELFQHDEDLVLSRMLKNGSLLLFRSSQNEFEGARSIPVDYLILDECQSMNMESLPVATESMSASKHGRLLCIGTGSIEGSSWERTFHTGAERTYNSKTKKWKLNKGMHDNNATHSYYLPQSTTGRFTTKQIEGKIASYLSRTIGMQEIEAAWTVGAEKPFPENIMRSCIIPAVDKVDTPQQYLGIDLGGGRSKTCLVLMHVSSSSSYYIDDAKIIETSNVDKQARDIIKYIERTNPVSICTDIGGGTHQTQRLESTFPRKLIKGHLYVNLVNPFEYNRVNNVANMDKTNSVDSLIDITEQGRLKIPKQFEWIIKHYTSVQSKIATTAGGQYYTKYFCNKDVSNDDACMATIFAMAAHRLKKAGRARIVGVY